MSESILENVKKSDGICNYIQKWWVFVVKTEKNYLFKKENLNWVFPMPNKK